MCRLFAFRSNVPSQAHHALVTAENAVSFQAEHHSDGWGIGYYLDDEPYLFRAAKGAAEDHRFQLLSESLRSNTFLVTCGMCGHGTYSQATLRLLNVCITVCDKFARN